MAQFRQWALEYVLSDGETAQSEIVQKAAKEIEDSRASSTAVGNWAASVQQWMTTASTDHDRMEDGDDGGSGDIIARAKALGFLAGTLEALDKTTLKSDQVLRLIGFFGAMFSYDHKAGITASVKALRQLYSMKGFKPDMGSKILEDVCKIKEDFRLQTAATRLEIYELFSSLLQDPAVGSELKHKYGSACGFVIDMLQVCQNERDPRNLMVWFKIQALLLTEYDPSPEITEEIFKVFSAYFPISLRSSATPIGITAEDLKEAVRSCFASHQRVASHAFPFLVQKLDQGDAVTVAVKVDVLKTIQACIERYDNPQASVVPYVEKIWNSLKYEVRNGEVKETIDATLDVLRTIARKLDGTKTQRRDVSLLKGYVDLVSRDCCDDLANPTYTKQAGLLLMTVICANIRAYVLYNADFVDTIRRNLRQPKSPSHTRDLLLLLNSLLKTRAELVRDRGQGHPDDEQSLRTETRTHLDTIFHDVYLPIWTSKANDSASEERDVLKQVAQGLALLVSQQVLQPDGSAVLLCTSSACAEICTLLAQTILKGLTLSSNDNHADDTALEDEVVLALRAIVTHYTDGYAEIVSRAKAEIRKRDWSNPSEYSLSALRDILSRLAFIGCSEIPSSVPTDGSASTPFSPLRHFATFTTALLELFPLSTGTGETRTINSAEGPSANAHVISAVHASILWFRDACEAKHGADVLASHLNASPDWMAKYRELPKGSLLRLQQDDGTVRVVFPPLKDDDPEVYVQFLTLSYFIVRHLYLSATSWQPTSWDERALVQLSQMAALVVRSIDEKQQICCNLAYQAHGFFGSLPDSSAEQGPSGLLSGLLTLGILQGLRPAAMAELYKPGGHAEKSMCDTSPFGASPARESDVRAAIAATLANKYTTASDPGSLVMKHVFTFWANWFTESTTTPSTATTTDPSTFPLHNALAMSVLAGAAARQDKHLLTTLIPALHRTIASPHPHGAIVARQMGLIVTSQHKDTRTDLLTPENHAVVKRFYRQWVYAHVVTPLLKEAQPTGAGDKLVAGRYRAAVLAVVRGCPFGVWGDDVEGGLMRLLVTALSEGGQATIGVAGGGEGEGDGGVGVGGLEQVLAALEVLVEVLANEPAVLGGYLREVVRGATGVYQACSAAPASAASSGSSAAAAAGQRSACRRLALQVLGAIPARFEERRVLPFAPPTQRMLAVACGDPVRKVREVARAARAAWAKLV